MAIILSTAMVYAGAALWTAGVLCAEFASWALPAVVGGALLGLSGAILHQRCIGRSEGKKTMRIVADEQAEWEDAA